MNASQGSEITENILKILYASEEEKVTIGEEGELVISGGGEGEDQLMNEEEK